MTNISLYDCDAEEITDLRQNSIIPFIRKSWHDSMDSTGAKFWKRIDWYTLRLREDTEIDLTVAERRLVTAMENSEQDERTGLDHK